MCGIAGGWMTGSALGTDLRERALRMAAVLRHRGPDAEGTYVDERNEVFLAHRRLSIVDLSASGHQPMRCASGRYWIAFNGEIYNHQALRAALPAQAWRGHSDTETLLAAIEQWGLAGALRRCVGMFALALFDTQARKLWLARDRAGEKPLYWGKVDGCLLFASELKAIVAAGGRRPAVNRSALAEYLRHGYVPAPHSIYQGIHKLPPGAMLCFDHDTVQHDAPAPDRYWDPLAVLADARRHAGKWDETSFVDATEAALTESVRLQMLADVPVGAFLSGGIDSSLVVALMQKTCANPVRTFTLGFDAPEMDEAPFARKVARHLGTEHTEVYVTETQARAVIPGLSEVYDEPFADSSQIPTLLVCGIARQQVTVALSGDGGDELFSGYSRYAEMRTLWQRHEQMAHPLRSALVASSAVVPAVALDVVGRTVGALRGRSLHRPLGWQLSDMRHRWACDGLVPYYRHSLSHWPDPAALIVGGAPGIPTEWLRLAAAPSTLSVDETLLMADTLTYLPDDILVKVDRAAMSHSLELRAPLLDWRLMELSWQSPPALRNGKAVLKTLLDRHVPRTLTVRPKMGFGVPLGAWLRGPLREWAEDLLAASTMERDGFLDPAAVRACWLEHLSGRTDWSYRLWIVLMFNAWLAGAGARTDTP